jgi:diadenosine tetraphosphatase ApaH/serine/threonine PP2A family protein phosphatase
VKLGILSDIHANIEAFTAVLDVLDHARVDRLVCAGDLVGYGPSPNECVELARERGIPSVLGNHDEYVLNGECAESRMQPDAKAALDWTVGELTTENRAWLASLPMAMDLADTRILHASHALRPPWRYVIDERTAVENFLFQSRVVAFSGHTHVPLYASHQHGQRPRLALLNSMFVPRNHRLLISVGSVGQPRDGDSRASCVVYDSKTLNLRVLRVPYDLRVTQRRIRDAGLPEELARRLASGR